MKSCYQLIHVVNHWIMTRELCKELNMGINELETTVVISEYCKVCADHETWYHHYKFLIKEKVQDTALSR